MLEILNAPFINFWSLEVRGIHCVFLHINQLRCNISIQLDFWPQNISLFSCLLTGQVVYSGFIRSFVSAENSFPLLLETQCLGAMRPKQKM